MLHLLRRNDLALRRAFAGKKQTEYMGGPGSDSAYELLPFGLSAYGRWMRHTQRWVKSLARRAVDARQGRDAFAVSTDYLVGPLLVKLADGVAVTGCRLGLVTSTRAACNRPLVLRRLCGACGAAAATAPP